MKMNREKFEKKEDLDKFIPFTRRKQLLRLLISKQNKRRNIHHIYLIYQIYKDMLQVNIKDGHLIRF